MLRRCRPCREMRAASRFTPKPSRQGTLAANSAFRKGIQGNAGSVSLDLSMSLRVIRYRSLVAGPDAKSTVARKLT